ncbi:hypothetical protein [Acinetobacter sp. A47]|uniref:hypothetical protein n=1 Tax=Acinetobacter sp. A47 TaxID=1561217 RepID=UPI0005716318|nr:hypothetical protein [Acinetobacter sp. A47]
MRQVIGVGVQPNDKKGDPARTGIQKANMNFLELWSFLAGYLGADKLPDAIPVLRGGTGATTAEGARKALGIGDAATKAVGNEEGNLFVVGTVGIGTDLAPTTLQSKQSKPNQFKSGEFTWLNSDRMTALTLGTRDAGIKAQFGIRDVTTVPTCSYRGSRAGTGEFSPWFDLYGGSNAITTVNGNIKAANNSLRLYHDEAVTQYGEKVFSSFRDGVYTLLATNLDTSNWTLEVPMDYKGVVEFEAAVAQAGSSVTVTVTKGGKPFQIPKGKWIDLHIK